MYIKVRVSVQSKKESLETKDNELFIIKVKEPAKNNRANRRVIEMIADHFQVSEKLVRIVNGHHSPSKLLFVEK